MNKFSAWFSLFASTGTLLCCALPSLLVVLGMGASMAGLVSNFPQLIWLSQHKAWVFGGSGFMICFAAFMHWRARNEPCPIDPVQARACTSARKWSLVVLIVAGGLWALGAFFAFLAPFYFCIVLEKLMAIF